MPEPAGAKAAFRKPEPELQEVGLVGQSLELRLNVRDAEVIAALAARQPAERERYALTALRIGVLALGQAGGAIDGQILHHEGERLIAGVESRLKDHANALNQTLEGELKRYFDPSTGHFNDRVKSLVDKDGAFANLIRQHLEGEKSTLALELTRSVGKNSPLMQYLSPQQTDGLIARITTLAQERLEEQSRKVLGEFDLNNPQGALKRLINQIETNFNPGDPKSALGVLNEALKTTQEQIRKDLTLDGNTSSMSLLKAGLKAQLDELANKQQEFQQAISRQLGIKQVQARTTEGGFSFEQLVGEAVRTRALSMGDGFAAVGEIPGLLKRKTGDHEQTLGPESAAPGAKIVFECKRDQSYRVKVALRELAEARENRQAEIGVFVMSAATLRDKPDLKAEYPAALARFDKDIIVVWDEENPATDVVLDAAVSLARALVIRGRREVQGAEAEELEEISAAISDLQKQFERFDKMTKWCDDISGSAENIKGELSKILKRLRIDAKSLTEGLQALRDTDSGVA